MRTTLFAISLMILMVFACGSPDKPGAAKTKNAKSDTVADTSTIRVMKEYFSNGKVKTETSAKGNLRHGPTRNYDRNGILLSEVMYVNNTREGMAKNFYPSGKMNSSLVYKHGIKDGDEMWYYESEKPYRVTPYVKGKINGTQKFYNEDGSVQSEVPYKNGQPGVGLKEYNKDGTLITGYPTLVIKQRDHLADANKIILEISLTDEDTKVKFYRGKLEDGKYLNDKLLELAQQYGIAQMDFNVGPGSAINQNIVITANCKTKRGNPLIMSRTFKVSAVNKN